MKKRKIARVDSGFTMIEILITMVLLMIVLLGLAMLQLTMIRQTTYSKRTAEATQLAQRTMERYRLLSITDLQGQVSADWTAAFHSDGLTEMTQVDVDGRADGPFDVKTLIEDIADAKVVISVQVSWLDIQPGTEANTKEYQTLIVELTTSRYY